ncbi:MAG: hypothetical protein WKG01_07075 [Kofleriaceae bacterium]
MRQPNLIRTFVLSCLALAFTLGTAFADPRSEAKTHYQAGVKAYNAGDYKSAIREFSTAQTLLPADLNNYNLALCYDKLGDPEPAIQYYRAYLDKVPATDKRAEIEASVSRLESASKSVAAKKADEARKAEELRGKKAADEARKAEEARKAAEADAQKKVGPEKPVGMEKPIEKPIEKPVGPELGPEPPGGPQRPTGVGSSGTPGGPIVSTGDSQLDRVAAIDVNAVRDQRVGGRSSGLVDRSTGPATQGAAAGAGAAGQDGQAALPPGEPQPKATPVYKKWWFWAVVGVSAYVVYSIASDNSNEPNATRGLVMPPMAGRTAAPSGGGLTLMSW